VRRSLLAVAVAGLTLLAQAAAAQQTFTSLAGPWWFTISGKDRGAIVIQFSAPAKGTFAVEDVTLTDHPSFGFSRELAAFFTVPAGEELALDSNRSIVGELALVDADTDADAGVLTIVKGKVDKTFTSMKLKGTIEGANGPVAVKLKGVRPPDAFPVLSGRTTDGNIAGKGVKSKALDLSVLSDGDLGPPAYVWSAAGPVSIDKEDTDATLDGRIMLTPNFKAFGLLEDSSDFGEGPVKGKLSVPDPNSPIPKVGLNAQADPTLKLKGTLITAVDPILQVTPTTFDFGAVRLNDPNGHSHTFLVKNVGVGLLSGAAIFLNGSAPDFEVTGNDSYEDLDPNNPGVQIVVTFDPQTTGAKTASLRFGVDEGLGSFVVALTGTGGVSELTVDPDPIVFDVTTPGGAVQLITATVTNTGDTKITGQASLSLSTVFTLMNGIVPAVQPIGLSIDPGNSQDLTIRFTPPTTATISNATLTLTGPTAGSKTVAITGTTATP